MNPRRLFFSSLLLNLALLGWIAWAVSSPKPSPTRPERAPQPATPSPAPEPARAEAALKTAPVEQPPPFHWRQVESSDYRIYIANLRAVGCPETTIRDIIRAELDELYTRKRQEFLAPWQGQIWDQAVEAFKAPDKWEARMKPLAKEFEKKDHELRAEKENLLKELLGNAPDKPEPAEPSRRRTPAYLAGYLSEEKRSQVQAVEEKYTKVTDELRKKYQGKSRAAMDSEFQEQTRQKLAEIQGLLTPAEFDEYRLRTSPATNLRYQVYGFEPTEDEWRALVRKKMEFDEANPYPPGDGPEVKAKRTAWEQARNQVNDQYKTVLGNERYETFSRAQQRDYQQIYKVAERCDLPAAVADQVYEMKRAAEAQARELRGNTGLSEEHRSAALQAIQRETENGMRDALGERAFQTYSRYGGDWVKGLGRP